MTERMQMGTRHVPMTRRRARSIIVMAAKENRRRSARAKRLVWKSLKGKRGPKGSRSGRLNQAKEEVMNILWAIVVGLVVGALAKLIMPGRDPGGVLVTILLGIAGAVLASFLGRALGWYAQGQSAGFIASVVGAIILLAIYRLIRGRP